MIPAHSGGKFFKASDGHPQADGRIYVAGDDPFYEPLLFDPATQAPVPAQAGANLGPRHAELVVVGNPDTGWRYENPAAIPDAWGPQPAAGATPQPAYVPGSGPYIDPTLAGGQTDPYANFRAGLANPAGRATPDMLGTGTPSSDFKAAISALTAFGLKAGLL